VPNLGAEVEHIPEHPLARHIIPERECIGALGQPLTSALLGVRAEENLSVLRATYPRVADSSALKKRNRHENEIGLRNRRRDQDLQRAQESNSGAVLPAPSPDHQARDDTRHPDEGCARNPRARNS
jgi:hypothetical protein